MDHDSEIINGIVRGVTELLFTLKADPKVHSGAILMGLGIAVGSAAKRIDHETDAAEYEGLDAVNSVAHQVYDAAILT